MTVLDAGIAPGSQTRAWDQAVAANLAANILFVTTKEPTDE